MTTANPPDAAANLVALAPAIITLAVFLWFVFCGLADIWLARWWGRR